jgi:death-on-curing protein
MRLTLLQNDFDILPTQDEKFEMTIAASKGDLRIGEIKAWTKEKLITNTQ